MSDKKYNGWTNYETWAVKLWIDNEEQSYRYWKEQADEAWGAADHDDSEGSAEAASDEARSTLARMLKAEIKDSAPEVSGLYADLLNAALGEVDWYEIANALLEDGELTDEDTGDKYISAA